MGRYVNYSSLTAATHCLVTLLACAASDLSPRLGMVYFFL